MKQGLNFTGRGYAAEIIDQGYDASTIKLALKKTNEPGFEGSVMTIKQDRDIIALNKSDIIALRDYLVQITPTL